MREREGERQRQHELRVKEMEGAAARDREHAERMASMARMELEAKASASGNDALGNTMKLFSQFGIPPEEVFPRMFGMKPSGGGEDEEGEEKAPGWMAALPVALGALGEVAKAMAARNAGGQPPMQRPMQQQQQQIQRPMPQQQVPRPLPPPQQQFMPSPQRAPQAQRALPPRMPQQQVRPQPVPVPAEVAPVEEPQGIEALGPPPEMLENVIPMPLPEPVVEQPKPSLSQLASEAGMSPKAQKSARVSLRSLIKKLAGSEESAWEELITTAIMSEINIYYYVKAVTVKAAMLECGAGEELAGRVVVAMRASSLVPSDLPYGDGGEA